MADAYVIGAGQSPFGSFPEESYRSLFATAFDRAVESVDGDLDPDALADDLVEEGVNPGTTADLTAAGLFVALARGTVSV